MQPAYTLYYSHQLPVRSTTEQLPLHLEDVSHGLVDAKGAADHGHDLAELGRESAVHAADALGL